MAFAWHQPSSAIISQPCLLIHLRHHPYLPAATLRFADPTRDCRLKIAPSMGEGETRRPVLGNPSPRRWHQSQRQRNTTQSRFDAALLACALTPSAAMLLPRQIKPSLEPLLLGGRSGVSTSVSPSCAMPCLWSSFAGLCSELREREEAVPALPYLGPPSLHGMTVVTGTCCGQMPRYYLRSPERSRAKP
jgi:hypothetical protein